MADVVQSAGATRQTLSGLEFFKRMIAGEVPPPPMVELLGLELTEAEPGRVVFTGTPDERCYNGLGVMHGGWAATLLDSALGCCINTMLPAGRVMTTLELKVNYTRAIRREAGLLRCIGTAIHVGNRVGTSEARIVDAGGKLYAHGTTTCILVERG
jgi:uncharacterized protein (TIGR00369 family)